MTDKEEYYYIHKQLSNNELLELLKKVFKSLSGLYTSRTTKEYKREVDAEFSAINQLLEERNLEKERLRVLRTSFFFFQGTAKSHLITGAVFIVLGILLTYFVIFIASNVPFLFYGLLILGIGMIVIGAFNCYEAFRCNIYTSKLKKELRLN